MEPVRVAVVGTGYMGSTYARIFAQLNDAELVGLCDRQPAKARALAAELGMAGYVGNDVATLCAQPSLQAVAIATAEAEHVAPALVALQHGLDVFVEKPLATAEAEARRILEAAEADGRLVMVGHTSRFDPRFAAAEQAIRRGDIGEVVHAYARRSNPSSRLQRLGNRVSVLGFLGVHDIDLLLWMIKRPVKSVFARGVRRALAALGLDDAIISLLTFADGTLAVLENAWGVPEVQGRPTNLHFSLRGTRGVIEINGLEQGFAILTPEAARFPDAWWRPERDGQIIGQYRDQMAHFVHCVRTRQTPWSNGRDALEAVRVMDAIERSLAADREVYLPEPEGA